MADQVEVTKEDIDNFNGEHGIFSCKQINETIEALNEKLQSENEEIISLTKTIDIQKAEIAKYKGIIQGMVLHSSADAIIIEINVAKPIIKAWLEMDSRSKANIYESLSCD